jgi:D-alanine--D-alanine ligase
VAFPAVLGSYGEDGRLQAMLEMARLPYVGSGVGASSLLANKWIAKRALGAIGVDTPDGVFVRRRSQLPPFSKLAERLGTPMIIKPNFCGASLGICVVETESQYARAAGDTLEEFGDALIEAYITGQEFLLGVLEDDRHTIVLPPCEQSGTTGVHRTETKLAPSYRFPSADEAPLEALASIAKLIHGTFCRGLSRTDAIVDGTGRIVVLEVNTLPGLLPASAFPAAVREAGISETEMYEMLLCSSWRDDPLGGARHPERPGAELGFELAPPRQ